MLLTIETMYSIASMCDGGQLVVDVTQLSFQKGFQSLKCMKGEWGLLRRPNCFITCLLQVISSFSISNLHA